MAYKNPTQQAAAQHHWYVANKQESKLRSRASKLRSQGREALARTLWTRAEKLRAKRQAGDFVSPAQQQRNLKQAVRAFRQWQKQHIKLCEDFAGPCCTGCHRGDQLYLLELDNGDAAHVCCLVRIANKLGGTGDESLALFAARNKHAVSTKPNRLPQPTSQVISKLPQGLLRAYLEGLQ